MEIHFALNIVTLFTAAAYFKNIQYEFELKHTSD